MSDTDTLKTPLYQSHRELGARMVPFAGYLLPVRYGELRDEHTAVRTAAGLFDVSHMGEIVFQGVDAENCLQYLTCNDVTKLEDGQAQYSAFLNQSGGVVDDIIVYRFTAEHFLLCVNAANTQKDFSWCKEHASAFDVAITDCSAVYGQIALQGPLAAAILTKLSDFSEQVSTIGYFEFKLIPSAYGEVILARTGYTGEDGFEIFVPAEFTEQLWKDLLQVGTPLGLLPCGLGARDTLRLEACYPLHGHELREDLPAVESGLGWIIKTGKGDFIGRNAVLELKQSGVKNKLIGFFVTDKGIVREDAIVQLPSGDPVGLVTSGTVTPTLDRALGLVLVSTEHAIPGTRLQAVVRGRAIPVELTTIPFYKR